MTSKLRITCVSLLLCVFAMLTACGGGGGGGGTPPPPPGPSPVTYTVGGSVSGLNGNLVLQNNGGDNLALTASGSFAFATTVVDGSAYAVSVQTQPGGQTCSVSAGTGGVSGSTVTTVTVVCSNTTYNVGGAVSGLSGTLVLQNNNGDNRSVTADGGFTFATPVASGSAYSVTVLTQPAGQSCSVANGTGTVTAAVTNVSITCASNTYTIGGTVSGLSSSVVLQNNGGNNLNIAANGGFTFSTALNNNAAYAVTVLTQPAGQTCTVSTGSGNVAAANVTNVAVNCVTGTLAGFAYVANAKANTISMYKVSGASGELIYTGFVSTGLKPFSVTVDPTGKFAYVANNGANPSGPTYTLSGYTINATTGALTSMGPDVAGGTSSPNSITVHPTGKFAYVANSGGNVSGYTINATTGVLTSAGSAVAAGSNPQSIIIDPTGKFAYVANLAGINSPISAYSINATTGVLTSISSAIGNPTAGTDSTSITIDPTGKFVYVANFTSGNVSVFTLNATTGALTSVGAVTAGSGPQSVTVDPSGKFAYVANWSGGVSAFTINATTGALTSAGVELAAGSNPASVTVDPTGKYVYVANYTSGNVSSYTINATTGALTSIGSTTATTTNPASITTTGILP